MTSGRIPYGSQTYDPTQQRRTNDGLDQRVKQTESTTGALQTLTNNGIMIGQSGNNMAPKLPTTIPVGTNGQVLLGQTGAAPSFGTVSGDGSISQSGALTVTKFNGSQGSSGQVLVAQASGPAAFETVGGDGAITAAGSLTVTKTNGASFANPGSAVTDTTNATNISTGTLSAGRLSSAVIGNFGGRLTLTSATPVLLTTVSGATTVYWTPYKGQAIPIYNGTSFVLTDTGGELNQATTDTTKSPAAVTTNSNYDIFVWSDSATIRATRGPAWSSDTSRGSGAGTTQLQLLNGIYVNAVAITNGPGANLGTYVGTFRSNGSSTIDWNPGGAASGGTAAILSIWNNYNRVRTTGRVTDNGASYTYGTATYRQARASTGNQASFLLGQQEDSVLAAYTSIIQTGTSVGNNSRIGIGLDSITTLTSTVGYVYTPAAAADIGCPCITLDLPPGTTGLGWHYVAGLEETASGTSTFNGDNTYFNQLTVAVMQ